MPGATSADKKARKAWLKAFVREESGQRKVAAYMVIYQLEGSPKEYLCIPHPASEREVTDRYFNDLHDGVGDASYKLQLLSFLLARNLKW